MSTLIRAAVSPLAFAASQAAQNAALAADAGTQLLGEKRTVASSVSTTQRQLNERARLSVFTFMTQAEVDDVRARALTLDVAAKINTADACLAAMGGGELEFPWGDYRTLSSIQPSNKNTWTGDGSPSRTNTTASPTRIMYQGAGGHALLIRAPAGASKTDILIRGIEFNGIGSTGLSNGLFLDAITNPTGHINGVRFEACGFVEFRNYQVYHDGTAFDVVFRDCNLHHYGNTTAGDVIHGGPNGVPTQWTFDNCFIIGNSAGKWAYTCEAANTVRFMGGTIGPNAVHGHGVDVIGYLGIFGTHLEGRGATSTTSIGMRYRGSLGADLFPAQCSLWGTPVQIGDGTASTARGWTLGGSVGPFNAGGGGDVVVTAGASRAGTLMEIGFAGGSRTIVNQRYLTDGVSEVCYADSSTHTARVNFTPVLIGSTAAGVGTYTTQFGSVVCMGNLRSCQVRVTWTAHTGTGNIQIGTLPIGFGPSAGTPAVSVRRSGLAITAGNTVQGYLDNSRVLQIEQVTAAGATSGVPMSAAGDLIVNFSWLSA